jgi:hypothetical protein
VMGMRRWRGGDGLLEGWVVDALRVVGEQGCIPIDQFARFRRCDGDEAVRVMKGFGRLGYVRYGRLLVREPRWMWLTRAGLYESGLGLAMYVPRPGGIARARAVNEVRLYVEARAPEARWVSRRVLVRDGGRGGHVPNGVVEIGAERHAVMVELGVQGRPRLRRIVGAHLERYEAVVVFAVQEAIGPLAGLCGAEGWDRVVVRGIPAGGIRSDRRGGT